MSKTVLPRSDDPGATVQGCLNGSVKRVEEVRGLGLAISLFEQG